MLASSRFRRVMVLATVFGAAAPAGCSAGSEEGSFGSVDGAGAGPGGPGGGGLVVDGSVPDGSGTTADSACLVDTFEGHAVPAVVMFQVDTSGSMNCDVNDYGCPADQPSADPNDSRWDQFSKTLAAAIPQVPSNASLGLMHFPTSFSCALPEPVVELGPKSAVEASFAQALQSVTPEGITPTHDAVLVAMAELEETTLEGTKYLVLATDGESTVCKGCDGSCSAAAQKADDEQMVQYVATKATEGIKTFVIGVQGSEAFRGILSRLASAAGTETAPNCSETGPTYCHYDLTDPSLDFSTALKEALSDISGAIQSCVFDIPDSDSGSFDPELVNVQVTTSTGTESISRDPGRVDGWDYSDDRTQIILHGAVCDEVKSAATARVDILYGCPTIVK